MRWARRMRRTLVWLALFSLTAACTACSSITPDDEGGTGATPPGPAPASAETTTTETTQDGMLRGTVESNGVHAFKGVPYAAPPVGALRWAPPQPLAPSSVVRDATQLAAPCAQVTGFGADYGGRFTG